MITQTTLLEEKIIILIKAIEELTKHIKKQDSQINKLMNNVDKVDGSCIMGKRN